jgi:hypothetical protein
MDDAAAGPYGLGLAPQLVSVTLDVVESIRNDDVVLRNGSFDRRELGGPGILFLRRAVVYLVSQRLCVCG